MIETLDIEQRSAEWYAYRLGVPTASAFRSIMAKGQGHMRRGYMTRLAAERLTGKVQNGYDNHHMERGRRNEQDALDAYAWLHEVELTRVGFVRMRISGGWVGCSPDALVGGDGVVEVKCPEAARVIDAVLTKGVEHRPQIQGGLWITGRQWCDLVLYDPDMQLQVIRIERDEGYIRDLAAEVEAFTAELAALEARFVGDPQAVLRHQLEASL